VKIEGLTRWQLTTATQETGPTLTTRTKVSSATAEQGSIEPAAIYHGSSHNSGESSLSLGSKQLYAQMLYSQSEWDEYMKVPPNVISGLGEPSAELRRRYDVALSSLSPELKAKDWSFSVSDGELVFARGQDQLSDEDLAALREALHDAGVESAANAVADVVVEAIETDRYWMYRHLGSGIGSYDVSKQNFGDVVNLRMYLEDYREGGRYDPHLRNPTDYALAYAIGGYGIMEQIGANAKQVEVPRRMVFV
jgi:hypothetical protein